MGLGEIVIRPAYRTLMRAYGVELLIESDDDKIFEHIKTVAATALVDRLSFEPAASSEVPKLTFATGENGSVHFDLDGVTGGEFKYELSVERFLNSAIRAYVAAKSKSWVFIHAGVVEWKGRALIFPGHSHQGKTTLVSELIRLGAGYMSDEYAVMDADGLVHPFERDLGVRITKESGPVPVDPAEFGGKRARKAVPAGMVALVRYVESSQWQPERLSLGTGIVETIPQVMPVSFNTEFVLKVLNTTFNRAIIVRSDRGEARDTAPRILEYFDQTLKPGGGPA